jgi:hypothetical protein
MSATAAMADSFIFPPVHSVIKAIRGLNLDTFAGKSTTANAVRAEYR